MGNTSWVQQVRDFVDVCLQFLQANPVALAFASLVLGVILNEVIHFIKRKINAKRELKQNQFINLSGDDWVAAWQASADDEPLINTEDIKIRQKGAAIWMSNKEKSPENPKGGYKWHGKLEFSHGETLMGYYYPLEEENLTARGIMYFTYDSSRKLFLGRWVGKAIDGVLCNGFVAISKDRDQSIESVHSLINKAKEHPVNIIRLDFLRNNKAA